MYTGDTVAKSYFLLVILLYRKSVVLLGSTIKSQHVDAPKPGPHTSDWGPSKAIERARGVLVWYV